MTPRQRSGIWRPVSAGDLHASAAHLVGVPLGRPLVVPAMRHIH